ncbi:MAG: 30S ribosomal protein S8 [Candidatus Dojkabacteria bacterium]
MINDPIGDFLTRIRNAQLTKKEQVEVPHSKILEAIASILKSEGFIDDFSVVEKEVQNILVLTLKYVNDVPAIRELKRISKPGIRKYRGYREIKPVKNGLGISIFSTPKGVITGAEAVKSKVGGEYICEVY